MDKVLQELLDMEKIRKLEHSECCNPEEILGAHPEKAGLLITAYLPDANRVFVEVSGRRYPMERVDADGFFAFILMEQRVCIPYRFFAEYANGETEEIEDPYSFRFSSGFTAEELKKLEAGTFYDSYEKLGAHPVTADRIDGVRFAVWAPNAVRVSVVGGFNCWNGKRHQMKRLGKSGVFELFIPGVKPGSAYKYEIKTSDGTLMMKSDPYAFAAELRPATASIVWDMEQYRWNDGAWMEQRGKDVRKEGPLSICEVYLGSWMRNPVKIGSDGKEINGSQFCNYREMAETLAAYVKEMGYTHVELMPVMEHPLDASEGFQVTGYYAPTSRYGTPDDFKFFVDHMHQNGIGVILDWVPASFPKDAHGLAGFDGTCLYEHVDPRQGEQPRWGTLNFNYGRTEVSNFLISSACFWAEKYHADGIRLNSVESMLYLDYGKNSGEWIANMYGSHENLDAEEFLRHLNSVLHKEKNGVMVIAEEATAWPRVTGSLKEEGLGFDYKWNLGWRDDFLRYMKNDPRFRHQYYGDLTFSMLYAYSEDFIQAISHDVVSHGNGSMLAKMPGGTKTEKLADLRTAYGFFMGHPGKKLLFMGQEYAQTAEWNAERGQDLETAKLPGHAEMKEYVKALNHLYLSHPALYEQDYEPDGFEWISCTREKENIVIFARYSKERKEQMIFVCNFHSTDYGEFRFGVPEPGTYREVLNSDETIYGGAGRTNPDLLYAEPLEKDGRAQSMKIRLAPQSAAVFLHMPEPEEKTEQPGAVNTEENKRTGENRDIGFHPVQTALAAKDALARTGADAFDRLSETVGKIIKMK